MLGLFWKKRALNEEPFNDISVCLFVSHWKRRRCLKDNKIPSEMKVALPCKLLTLPSVHTAYTDCTDSDLTNLSTVPYCFIGSLAKWGETGVHDTSYSWTDVT